MGFSEAVAIIVVGVLAVIFPLAVFTAMTLDLRNPTILDFLRNNAIVFTIVIPLTFSWLLILLGKAEEAL